MTDIASPEIVVAEAPTSVIVRAALRPREAASALGVSLDFFEAHIQHELRWVYRGRLRLCPVKELERWLDDNAVRAGGRRRSVSEKSGGS